MPGEGYFPSSYWSGIPETTKQYRLTAIAFGGAPELDGKTLLLKTSYTLVVGHRNQAGTDRRLPLCWLAFLVLTGTMQASGGEMLPTVSPSYELGVA